MKLTSDMLLKAVEKFRSQTQPCPKCGVETHGFVPARWDGKTYWLCGGYCDVLFSRMIDERFKNEKSN